MNRRNNLILAIESAIGGGSLSIWEGDREIDFWVGTGTVSKAEDLLEGFSKLLEKNRLPKDRFKLIAFSTEPGSPTGLKIGTAIAQGLSKSLGCKPFGISMWDALAKVFKEVESAAVVLPIGKNMTYRHLENGEFSLKNEILDVASVQPDHNLGLFEMLNLGENFAYYIGKSATTAFIPHSRV